MTSLRSHPVGFPLWFAAEPPRGSDDAREEHRDADPGTRSLRVLIVEDEFFISLDMQDLLHGLGHTVVGIAVSADQAVQIAHPVSISTEPVTRIGVEELTTP